MAGERVLGVDACKAGWFGIVLGGSEPRALFAPHIAGLAQQAGTGGPLAAVGIDIPIGLADSGRRQADVLARRLIGPRWASVFITPVRAALLAGDYARAAAENRRLAGEGLSRQAFALQAKILDADRWVRTTPLRVAEIHPEVSFARLAGGPLRLGKTSWAGAALRRKLLAQVGIVLPDDLGAAGEQARVDDVLDAAVVAWTAQRVASGKAHPLPDPPETFSDGIPCAIWV